jgi:uncharacterized protein YndB with AHSA1/START domain
MPAVSDRIEKQILVRAPHARVWKALTDSREFGSWFGMRVNGPFAPGATLHGTITGTTVDPEIAKAQSAHEGVAFDIIVERIDPQRLFSFRWHPFAIDRTVDYSKEPTTLVTFELNEADGGVLVRLTESGFDTIPLERRAAAFAANEGGWSVMVGILAKYAEQQPV